MHLLVNTILSNGALCIAAEIRTADHATFVLAIRGINRPQYVTWMRDATNDGYSHGHYFDDFFSAAADLAERVNRTIPKGLFISNEMRLLAQEIKHDYETHEGNGINQDDANRLALKVLGKDDE
jgi:hypothetical protein